MTVDYIWTIYNKAIDYPDKIVARMFQLKDGDAVPTETIIVSDSLETIRGIMLSEGRFCFPRDYNADDRIIETWI
jgi:hypothetical protein